jgi:hypothetical protein
VSKLKLSVITGSVLGAIGITVAMNERYAKKRNLINSEKMARKIAETM